MTGQLTTSTASDTLQALNARHVAQPGTLRTPFTLRMHRALSWLNRAEAATDDLDMRFICLWVGFNAAYAQDLGSALSSTASERQRFRSFISEVCRLDTGRDLSQLVWQEFSGPIRVLPVMLTIMSNKPESFEGRPFYPVVQD